MLKLFLSFLKVGMFTIGGGYAMIPLMRQEVVERRAWLTDEEFLDQVSLSQAMPGAFAVNMATAVGYRQRGLPGAVAAVLGNVALPIVVILLIAVLFRQYGDNEVVEHVFMGIRPAVVALIAAPVVRLARKSGITWRTVWVPVAAVVMICVCDISPMVVVLVAFVAGVVYSMCRSL